jgi:uncharacterized protein (DUF885 family)
MTRRALAAAGAALLTAACANTRASDNADQLLAEALAASDEASLRLNPQNAVARGDLRFARQFGDFVSDSYFRALEQNARADNARLRNIRRDHLSDDAKVAYDVFAYQTETTLASFANGAQRIVQDIPIDPYTGFHLSFPQWSSGNDVAPFRTLEDYENGLARLHGYAAYLDAVRNQMRSAIHATHVMSHHAAGVLANQLRDILSEDTESSPFLGPIRNFPNALDGAERTRFTNAYRSALTQHVLPALTRLRDFVTHEYLPNARHGPPGLTGMTDGDAYYGFCLEQHTTTRLGADAIHEMGLSEVARILGEMERTKGTVGFSGSLQEFFVYLRTDAQFKPASARALLGAYQATNERVSHQLSSLFGTLPRGSFEIRPVPPEQENSVGGAYYVVGAPDGSRPGVFFVNTSNLESRTTPPMTSLFLHEAVPSHHLQGTLAQENQSLPALLRYGWNTGFGEGWALYAESLGQELGVYEDPYAYFGHLDLEMFRALRLVVDTGLHAKSWSRQQAIDYMLANSPQHRSYIEQEVDRYISWPGQATAYKVGELVIKRLRAEAERSRGARFDIRAFHDEILRFGCLPLFVLEQRMRRWAAS